MEKKSQSKPLIISKMEEAQVVWNKISVRNRDQYMYFVDNICVVSVKCNNTTTRMSVLRNTKTNYDTLTPYISNWLSKSASDIKPLESFPDSSLNTFFST